ncbi:MAG: peptide ABC transporter permease [Candidatus Melainabacteria bacterium HGW-Melainabacteria-1]|nr:MAG: peptide ABC transporter permease [Candidatus Melainabacteria bacterium HGW-Melainabacteria-1]
MITQDLVTSELRPPTEQGSLQVVGRRILRNKSFMLGGSIVVLFLLLAFFPGLFTRYDPLVGDLGQRLLAPSATHWFGTDDLGRDILARVVYGAQISLQVGLISVGIALVIGSLIGVIAGYFGGYLGEVLMRIIDIILAFPSILLAILIVAILGPGLVNAMIAIGIVNVPIYARLLRSTTLQVRNQEFIEAAHAMGASHTRIIWFHIMPNCLSPLIVQATLGIGAAILETAGLSFLGLGAQPPTPEWGTMLSQAKDFIRTAPWTLAFPGLAITLVVVAFNLMGDGLRDLIDPRTAKKL